MHLVARQGHLLVSLLTRAWCLPLVSHNSPACLPYPCSAIFITASPPPPPLTPASQNQFQDKLLGGGTRCLFIRLLACLLVACCAAARMRIPHMCVACGSSLKKACQAVRGGTCVHHRVHQARRNRLQPSSHRLQPCNAPTSSTKRSLVSVLTLVSQALEVLAL